MVLELMYGAYKSEYTEKNLQAVNAFLMSFDIVDFFNCYCYQAPLCIIISYFGVIMSYFHLTSKLYLKEL